MHTEQVVNRPSDDPGIALVINPGALGLRNDRTPACPRMKVSIREKEWCTLERNPVGTRDHRIPKYGKVVLHVVETQRIAHHEHVLARIEPQVLREEPILRPGFDDETFLYFCEV